MRHAILTILNSRYFIWALLALPSLPMLIELAAAESASGGGNPYEHLIHESGEFSARFLIVSLAITPLKMLMPRSAFWRWMLRRRRYFGVAAFCYAAFHLMVYLVDTGSLSAVLGEALQFGIWTGWLALFVFIPLAITSNDFSVRMLGPKWKVLHRAVYVAAVATVLHWIFASNAAGGAIVHFLPLALLEGFRIYRRVAMRRPA